MKNKGRDNKSHKFSLIISINDWKDGYYHVHCTIIVDLLHGCHRRQTLKFPFSMTCPWPNFDFPQWNKLHCYWPLKKQLTMITRKVLSTYKEGLSLWKFLENCHTFIKADIFKHDCHNYCSEITGYWSSTNIMLRKSQFSLTKVTVVTFPWLF